MAIGFDRLTSELNANDPILQFISNAPDRLEAGRIQRGRQSSLAGVDTTKAASLLAAGQKLFALGDFEGGNKLIEQGRQLKAAETAAFANEAYSAWLRKPQPGPPTTPPSPTDIFTGVPRAAPGPAGETPPWPVPGAGQVLPPGTGTGAAAPLPGPRAEAPPADEFKPYKIAGPMMGPPGVPGTEPVAEQAQYLPSYATPEGRSSVYGSPSRPSAPRQQPPLPAEEMALTRARQAIDELRQIPGVALAGNAKEAKLLEARRWLGQAKTSPEHNNWYNANFARMGEGLEPLTFDAYNFQKEIGKTEFESTQKRYDLYQDKRRKAEELSQTIDQLSALVNHNKFESGKGSELVDYGKSILLSAKNLAKSNGIPLSPDLERQINTITTSVQLRETFKAIAGSGIFEKLGSLGAQTSDRDLTFTKAMFPSLETSVEGNKMIIEYYKHAIAKNRELGKRVQEVYGKFKRDGVPISPLDIDDVATKFWDDPKNSILKNPDESLTPLGERMANYQARLGGGVPPPGEGTPLGALEAASGPIGRGIREALTPREPAPPPAPPAPAGAIGEATGPDGQTYTVYPDGRIIGPDGKPYSPRGP